MSTACKYLHVITLYVQPLSVLYISRSVVCILDRLWRQSHCPQAAFLLSCPLCYMSLVTFSVFPFPKVCLALFICDGLNDSVPAGHMFEYLVISWWWCLGGLGGAALLEEVCHWGGLWDFKVISVCSPHPTLLVVQDVSSQLLLQPPCLLAMVDSSPSGIGTASLHSCCLGHGVLP